MKQIILVGSHGTGKTTLLKEYNKKYDSLAIMDGISRPVHIWLKNKSYNNGHDEQELINDLTFFNFKNNSCVKNLAITRSPLDCVVYSEVLGYYDLAEKCKEEFSKLDFSNVCFIYIPIEFDLEDDGIRYTDKQLQKDIDESFIKYLKEYNIQYETITGSVEERIEKLHNLINKNK